jgi:hypothetical protein
MAKLDFDVDHIKKIPPTWWAVVAGAGAAGATIFDKHRVLAGAVAAGAAFLFALYVTPCCDGCAAGQGCGGPYTSGNPLAQPGQAVATIDIETGDAAPSSDPGMILSRGGYDGTTPPIIARPSGPSSSTSTGNCPSGGCS